MIDPGVFVERVLDPRNRRVIVDRRIDADPILGEIDAGDFFSLHGTPNMGPEVSGLPGWHRRSRLSRVVVRMTSSWDVPVLLTQCMRKFLSLNLGKSDCSKMATPRGRSAQGHRRSGTLDAVCDVMAP